MLVFDLRSIGDRLLATRKRSGLTQAEAAEAAGLSDRAYADIERGMVNMRLGTLLRICQAMHITPDELLTTGERAPAKADILARLESCSPRDRQTALQLLDVYLQSLDK